MKRWFFLPPVDRSLSDLDTPCAAPEKSGPLSGSTGSPTPTSSADSAYQNHRSAWFDKWLVSKAEPLTNPDIECRRPRILPLLLLAGVLVLGAVFAACADDDDDEDTDFVRGAFKDVKYYEPNTTGVLSDGTENDGEDGISVTGGRYVWAVSGPQPLHLTMPDDYVTGSTVNFKTEYYDESGTSSTTLTGPSDRGALLTFAQNDVGHKVYITIQYINNDDRLQKASLLVPVVKMPSLVLSVSGNNIQADVNGGGAQNIGTEDNTLVTINSGCAFEAKYKEGMALTANHLYLNALSGVNKAKGVIHETDGYASNVFTAKILKAGTAVYEVREATSTKVTKPIANITVDIKQNGKVTVTGVKIKQRAEK